MTNICAVLGASGHGKVVAEIAELNGYNQIDFFDDRWPDIQFVEHWQVCGNSSALLSNCKQYDAVFIAIGNNDIRFKKQKQCQMSGAIVPVLVHPRAIVSKYAQLGEGTVVMANAVISSFVVIGSGCIVNTSASVDHDCTIADGVHISPGVNLAGGVKVDSLSWIGIGSQVKQFVHIGHDVTVGAGSTVIKDIPHNQTVVGNPARCIDHFKS